MDDEFGGLLDRESVLAGGVPARRANTVLFLIENRTAQLVDRSRHTMDLFHSQETAEERELAFIEAFSVGNEPPLRPKIQDLERYAPQWASLVPRNPRVQAAIAHRLGEKYGFAQDSIPGIRGALGLDNAAVQRAYQRLYGQPLEGIFAERATPGERLRWAWTAVSGWLENLPPFWTAYALTLTETVGVTILALPIAVAGIGPLAGVAILVALGIINVLTIAGISEAVSRSGTIRYGSAFIGRVVEDFLGRAGSIVLSLGIFVLCFLVLQAFYIGFASALQGATGVSDMVWVALLFLAGLYFLRRESLNATVASALVVGAVNIVLVVVLSLLAFARLRPENLLYVNVPFLDGKPLQPEVLGLVFGVILSAYFGHLSVSNCARVVLRRDPGARSLLWGTAAAQVTAIALYSLFVLAVNGAIAPEALSGEVGTALDPLAADIGPVVYVLGSVFVLLGLGMGSIHYSLALFNITRERLPTLVRPVVTLPRRQGTLLFSERKRDGLRLGVVYIGLRSGKPRFRLDIESEGGPHQVETTAMGNWEVLGPNGDPSLLARLPRQGGRGGQLTLEIMEADQQRVRLQVTSSMRTTYEGNPDASGLDLAGILALSDAEAGLISWITRQGRVNLAEAAEYAGRDEDATRTLLGGLTEKGYVAESNLEGKPGYEARLATRRGRKLPQQIWQALGEEDDPPPEAVAPRPSRTDGISRFFRELSSSKYGGFLLAVSPVAASFLLAEWLLLTGAGSFTGLLGFIGVAIIPILGGIFPVLLLVASRRKGERIPEKVYRFLGNPVLVVGIYVLFLASIFLHGLVIWTNPLERACAMLVGVMVIVLTFSMRGTFTRRTVVELREDEEDGERASFSVIAAGHPYENDVCLSYPEGEQRHEAANGEVSAFASLRQATFKPVSGAGATTLKVWAHKVTPEGDSEGLVGFLNVRQGDDIRRFDLKLSRGQVELPVVPGDYEVEITLSQADDEKPGGTFDIGGG